MPLKKSLCCNIQLPELTVEIPCYLLLNQDLLLSRNKEQSLQVSVNADEAIL
jgi:hypothetical protein